MATAAQLIRLGDRALERIEAAGGPPAADEPAVLWAAGVLDQARATDGGLGALWFVPLLRMAVLALTAVAGAVGMGVVIREGPKAGASLSRTLQRGADAGLNIALAGLAVWIGLALLDRRRR